MIITDFPFIYRWKSFNKDEKRILKNNKAIILDFRTDKLISGEKNYLKGFKIVLNGNNQEKRPDVMKKFIEKINKFLNGESGHLELTDISFTILNALIDTAYEEFEFDIITAPYFPINSPRTLLEITKLNEECLNLSINHEKLKNKDIIGVLSISKTILDHDELWDQFLEILNEEVSAWAIRISPIYTDTNKILSQLSKLLDEIIKRIGDKPLFGLDFELYEKGPFGYILLAYGLDGFSSSICETDEIHTSNVPKKREPPYGFYYLKTNRHKKHVKNITVNDMQECPCPDCQNLIANPLFENALPERAFQNRLKDGRLISLKKIIKRHFLYCRRIEMNEFSKALEEDNLIDTLKIIAHNSHHDDWEFLLDNSR